jgi:hypothetical protein
MDIKACPTCGPLAATEFYPGKRHCKDCVRARARAYRGVYYDENREKVLLYQRAYSARSYAALTPPQRRQRNRKAWNRWGRRRYMQRRYGRTADLRLEFFDLHRELSNKHGI